MKKEETYSSFGILPEEEMIEVETKSQDLMIGIPKESSFQENRISLTPDAVELLVNNNHKIILE